MSGGTRSYEMARRMVAKGHEVHMITSDREISANMGDWEEEIIDGITIHWLGVPYDNKMSFFERVKAFGVKIISEYGAAESGLIAFECEKGNMHINVENIIVEIEDEEIVVTNLLSKSFPIIRYKLGDKVTLSDPDFICSCGRNHPVIIDVLGRVGKKIMGHQQKYPSLMFYNVFKNLAVNSNIVLNYQAVQNEIGKVTLLIEQQKNDSEKPLQNELFKYFSDDVDFTVKYEQNFHVIEGKLKDFITNMD